MANSESLPENTEANGGRFMKFLKGLENKPVAWMIASVLLGPMALILLAVVLSGLFHATQWLAHLAQ